MIEPARPALASPAWRIEWHAELPSTMTRARELAEAGAAAGTVVVADYQSEGRGTHGRSWLAPPGSCLMFTLIARPTIPLAALSEIPLRVSESIAAFLRDEHGLRCDVKPPNDIIVTGKKLCGVLCTSHLVGERVEWLLVGIGLNTNFSETTAPLETAVSLRQVGIEFPSHSRLLDQLLAALAWITIEQ